MFLAFKKIDTALKRLDTVVFILCHLMAVALLTSMLATAGKANAQNILVPTFTDLTGKAKFGQKAQKEIINAFKLKGATLKDNNQYLATVKKNGIPANKALVGPTIKKLSKGMNINCVVIGKAVVEKRKYKLILNVFDQKGAIFFKKNILTQQPEFAAETADDIVTQIYSRLGIAKPSQPEFDTSVTQPVQTEPAPTPKSSTDSALPSWARNETAAPVPASPPPTSTPPPTTQAEEPAKPAEELENGSVSDILVAVGSGANFRSGLSPRHDSNAFPDLRIDGRFMLGTFTNVIVAKDFGVGGSFNMGLGLKYRADNSPTDWPATQYQWYADLIYRFALNSVALQPALLLRVGYGMTTCTIDTGKDTSSLAKSVEYKYPFAAIDIYLMLWKPYLRLFVSPSFMFLVQSGKDVKGQGMGFSVLAGLELQLFKYLEISAGYELNEFMINIDSGGSTSDMYQTVFGRLGFTFH
jgi:hypothetical protein